MADDTEEPVTPVAPPPQLTERPIPPGYDPGPLPKTPGQGYTYSTPGPADWTNKQAKQLPGGEIINIPANAQNFTSIVGPPPEDQETAAFRKMFNSLPMDQAIKAYQAAKQFQGQRVLQSKLAGYSAAGLPPEQALSRAMTDAAAVGLFSTPKEMLDLHKGLSTSAADKAKAQFDARKLAMDAAAARQAASQQFQLQKMQLGQGGSNTRLQLEQYQKQRDILQRDVDKAEEGVGSLVMDDEGQARLKAKKDKIDAIDNQMDTIRKQLGLTVPETEQAPKKTPFKEGARIRNKKDGKMYVVRNGVPVPEGR